MTPGEFSHQLLPSQFSRLITKPLGVMYYRNFEQIQVQSDFTNKGVDFFLIVLLLMGI